jgi:hypothetical protein
MPCSLLSCARRGEAPGPRSSDLGSPVAVKPPAPAGPRSSVRWHRRQPSFGVLGDASRRSSVVEDESEPRETETGRTIDDGFGFDG